MLLEATTIRKLRYSDFLKKRRLELAVRSHYIYVGKVGYSDSLKKGRLELPVRSHYNTKGRV